jgi:PKD repeat protein
LKLLLSGVGVLAAAALVAAPGADAMRVKIGGRVYGVMPTPAALSAAAATRPAAVPQIAGVTAPAGWNVQYQGGPVLHSAAPYVIYWDPTGTGIAARSRQVIDQYLTDVAADSGEVDDVYGVGRQYYDRAGIADASQTFSASSQALVDPHTYPSQDTTNCPTQVGYSTCITDAQLRAELTAFITANHLPVDGPTTESEFPGDAPVYFLILPKTVNTCNNSGDCSGGPQFGFCAEHSYYQHSGSYILYSDVPFSVFTEFGTKGCQFDNTGSVLQAPNGDPADNVVDDLSHELNETITDPLINAWVNTTNPGNELADQCQEYDTTVAVTPLNGNSANAYEPTLGGSAALGTLYDQLINGDQYYTQSLWSNGQVDCEMQPTPTTLTPSFTVSGAVPGQVASVSPSAAVPADQIASVAWNWGDGTSNFAPGGLAATSHTFAAVGIYNVTLTLVDAGGNLATVTKQVSVGRNPTAAIGSLPAVTTVGSVVAFSGSPSTDPNGTAIANFNWNFGDSSTDTGVTATHAYSAPGVYTVTLGVNDSYGFSASTTATIDVLAVGKIGTVSAQHSKTSAYALVKVTQAGSITYAGHATKIARAGTAKIKLKLTAKQRRLLKQGRKFTVIVKLVYTPTAGARITQTKRITL